MTQATTAVRDARADWRRDAARVREVAPLDPAAFARDHAGAGRPVVVRGLVRGWPLIAAGQSGPGAAAAYLRRFDHGASVRVMRGPAEIAGRFFYDEGMQRFNFTVEQQPLRVLLDALIAVADDPAAPVLYAGSNPIEQALPGLDCANPMPLAAAGATPRIWIGNRTHVATHYDAADNIAVVAMGHRRFTLFPPAALPDLYVGPLDVTLAGQPTSMIDVAAPDLARYPRFARAMKRALVADLEPGDAIFMPALWWHCVEASGAMNILVNYWHNGPAEGPPFAALIHAMLSVRDLPAAQRDAWRVWFDHLVFGDGATDAAAHLPAHVRGVMGPPNDLRRDAVRAYLTGVIGMPPGG